MNQRDLNRAVASATGESVQEIIDRGFGLMIPPNDDRRADGVELHPDGIPHHLRVPAPAF